MHADAIIMFCIHPWIAADEATLYALRSSPHVDRSYHTSK